MFSVFKTGGTTMKTNLMAILATTTMLAGTAQASEVIFAHGSNPGNPRYEAAEKWAEVFAECTGGDHSVNVAGSATMGDDVEMLTSASCSAQRRCPISRNELVPKLKCAAMLSSHS